MTYIIGAIASFIMNLFHIYRENKEDQRKFSYRDLVSLICYTLASWLGVIFCILLAIIFFLIETASAKFWDKPLFKDKNETFE